MKKEEKGSLTPKEKGSSSSEEDKAKEEVTTDHTTDILKDDEVEKVVHTAAEETDDATEEEIVKEINDGAKEYYTDNGTLLLDELNKKIEEFNKKDEKDRIKQIGAFEYSLNSKNLLDKADMRDMEVLYKNLIYMAGSIVPYFNLQKGKRTQAFFLTLDYIFEIYAVKKDPTGKLSSSDAEIISSNIKEKYK